MEKKYTKREIDFIYLTGVFNASGIDGLAKEIARLKELGKDPSDIIDAARNQSEIKKVWYDGPPACLAQADQ